MDADEITCRDTTWLVSDGRDRQLSEKEKANLLKHIASCNLCRGASTQFDVLFRQIEEYFKPE